MRTMIASNILLDKAKKYYNCSDLKGLEIEEIYDCPEEFIY